MADVSDAAILDCVVKGTRTFQQSDTCEFSLRVSPPSFAGKLASDAIFCQPECAGTICTKRWEDTNYTKEHESKGGDEKFRNSDDTPLNL